MVKDRRYLVYITGTFYIFIQRPLEGDAALCVPSWLTY